VSADENVTNLADRRSMSDEPLDRSLFWRVGAPAAPDVDVIRVEVLRGLGRGTRGTLAAADAPPVALTADTAGDLAMALLDLRHLINHENMPPAEPPTSAEDAPACPSWCERAPHGFSERIRTSKDWLAPGIRHHYGEVAAWRVPTGFPGETVELYSIGLTSTEFDPAHDTDRDVAITVNCGGPSLDASEVRRFAMQLLEAAAKLDELKATT
jgi:hypothetical protein